ncbi:MAG TPA: hypothetical protein VMU87_00990 [Stellaceae bacterium]|nr:hypothetical protein [Stellaceae bacterium]
MPERGTIRLGGADYVIEAFTLDELQLAEGFFRALGAADPAQRYDAIRGLIGLALRRSPAEIGTVRTSFDEAMAAVAAIAALAGVEKKTMPTLQ